MIFNVGARRSGTFWLQRIVTTHPEVAAVPSETGLFSHGIAPLFERFTHGLRGNPEVGQIWMDRADLLDATREFCDRVFQAHMDPGVPRLAERTPIHVSHLELIGEVYPDGRVVHIIRDGRDVAMSLVRKGWGPDTIEEAAREWRDAVLSARAGKVDGRYTEVRYEHMAAEPDREIRRLFAELELEADRDIIDSAVAEARVEANVDAASQTVGSEKWRTGLDPDALQTIDEVAGDLLDALGYPPSKGSGSRLSTVRRWTRDMLGPSAAPTPDVTTGKEHLEGDQTSISIRLLDAVLVGMSTGRLDQAAGLLAPEATFEHVSARGRDVTYGSAARDALLLTMGDDPVSSARQRSAELFHRASEVIGIVAFDLDDGSSAERLFIVSAQGDLIARLVVYELPAAA